ncbi:MAG: hypothetical protein H6747_10800 [Deltaproteobacteria bacterium]|nr:hypothetical protein [Deltaproteobacteria bacterium]
MTESAERAAAIDVQIARLAKQRKVVDGVGVAGFASLLVARWAEAPQIVSEVLLGFTLVAACSGLWLLFRIRRLRPRGVQQRDFF